MLAETKTVADLVAKIWRQEIKISSSELKRRGTTWILITAQFKSLHVWSHGGALIPMQLTGSTSQNPERYIVFTTTYTPIQMCFWGKNLYISAKQCKIAYCINYNSRDLDKSAELICLPTGSIWSIMKWKIQQSWQKTVEKLESISGKNGTTFLSQQSSSWSLQFPDVYRLVKGRVVNMTLCKLFWNWCCVT